MMRRVALLFCAGLVIAMSASAGVPPPPAADITVMKTGPDQSADDTDVTYMVTITNFGPDDSPGVTLDDPIPPGMTFVSAMQTSGPPFSCSTPAVGGTGSITCTIATFMAAATADFTFVTHITAGAAPGTAFTNIATASSTIDPNSENDAGVTTTFTPVAQADMGVQKEGPSAASPGQDVTYSIMLVNGGPNDAAAVAMNDTLPGDMTFVSFTQTSGPALSCSTPAVGSGGTVTCTADPFPTGQTATFTLVTNIPAATASGTFYTNSVSVTSNADPNVENDVSTISLLVSAVDVSVTKAGPATAVAGTDITYTITIANAGPDTATSTMLIDTLPPATTFVSLVQDNGPAAGCSTPAPGSGGTVSCLFGDYAPGSSAQFTLTIRAGDTTSITNTATGGTESSDTNTSNNSASVTTTITPIADMAITKTAPTTVSAGSSLTFAMTVTNNGPSSASAVTVTDVVPAGTTFVSMTQNSGPAFNCTTPAAGGTGTVTCTIATLAPASIAAFSLTVSVPTQATVGTTITNTATVSATTPADPDATNNSATTTTTSTQPVPGLSPAALAALAVGLALAGTVLLRR